MPIPKIIFLKNVLRDDVSKCWLDKSSGQYAVVFSKGDGKRLYYNPDNVDILDKVRQLEPPFRVIRTSDGQVFHKVLGVYEFTGKLHKAYRVIYEDGQTKNYPAGYVEIEEHIDSHRSLNVLNYLHEVAQYSKIPVDEEKTISLAEKYEKASFVVKGSLMEAFLNPSKYPGKGAPVASAPIFPFGCNRSQYQAVLQAMSNPLSIIQGPPGTGKTQTILNIMANLVLEGRTVQIVSNNNSAIENVQEKLARNRLDFFVAKLGRASNKESFIKGQTGKLPEMAGWKQDDSTPTPAQMRQLSKELQSLYAKQERDADLASRLAEVRQQMRKMGIDPAETPTLRRTAEKLMALLLRCNNDLERKGRLRPGTRIRLWRLHLHTDASAIPVLEREYYLAENARIERERAALAPCLRELSAKADALQHGSMALFKSLLHKRYDGHSREIFQQNDSYLRTRDFLKEYPVVLSTTFSATTNINPDYRFDYLIMDEASQVDVAAGALALNSAKRAVIVGDLKQLPNVVDASLQETSNAVFAKYGIAESYRFASNSFLAAACALIPSAPSTLLREHYRCHPQIIGFCNRQFYGGELIPMSIPEDDGFAAVRLVRTAPGNHARGTFNQRQVDTIAKDVIPALSELYGDIGIIAPYNRQVALLEKTFKDIPGVTAATVHKFQGREKDAIVLSTVDNQIGEFADDPHLLNVAVSRARKIFILVTSSEDQPDSNVKDLMDYIEYWSGEAETGTVRSVFDLLYDCYTEERRAFLSKHARVSEYDSENIMYGFLEDLFAKHGLTHLGVLLHYPLRQLVPAGAALTAGQQAYAAKTWTHIDFLVYNKITHVAVLAIEVDGYEYHSDTTSQHSRDILKDGILDVLGLPHLRLSTTGSDEARKILSAIKGPAA